MQLELILLFSIIPFLLIGFLIGKNKPLASEKISIPLIKFGIPISVMGLLLKNGVDRDLLKAAIMAFFTISFLIMLINCSPKLKKIFPNYTLQLGGLIGNTSFLGIPIAMALLPTNTIDLTIGFDLGTTFFAWLFGPYLLQNRNKRNKAFNIKKILIGILSSPASKGIIGVLITYQLGVETYFGEILWIPAIIIIFLAIIVVGTRLGIIIERGNKIFDFSGKIQYSLILKQIVLPIVILFVFALFRSILSYPTPCLEIILSFLPALIISSFNFAVLNETPSQSFILFFKFSFDKSSTISKSKFESFSNKSIPDL